MHGKRSFPPRRAAASCPSCSDRADSPDGGNQPVRHLGTVVPVAWEVGGEIRLLILEPPDDQNKDRGKEDESPPGPQRQRSAEKQQQSSTIHGVADERIAPPRNDGLLCLHVDRCGSKWVDAKPQQAQNQSTGDQEIPD